MNGIQSISQITQKSLEKTTGNQEINGAAFKNIMNSLQSLSVKETEANNLIEQYVTGEVENVHEVLLALEEFQMAVQMTTEVRNKLVESFKEIKNMQI
jgi:flagellar hook-basal body complex protein FliE